jgi:hypothetical protein
MGATEATSFAGIVVRQDQTLGAIEHPLYASGGTASVLALAVARRQREIIGNSLYTSAR